MKTDYNVIAGQNLGRLETLSDGVFAIVMTLLILEFHVPDHRGIHSERELWTTLISFSPHFITYVMSFLTLGIFWVGQQTQMNQIARSDRNFTWMHIGFLLATSVMPFSTAFLAEFITYKTALFIYWMNIFLLGVALYVSRQYAWKAQLVKKEVSPAEWKTAERRIITSQLLYAGGALLSVFSTYVSIAVIVLLQLNYVIAPRIRTFFRT